MSARSISLALVSVITLLVVPAQAKQAPSRAQPATSPASTPPLLPSPCGPDEILRPRRRPRPLDSRMRGRSSLSSAVAAQPLRANPGRRGRGKSPCGNVRLRNRRASDRRVGAKKYTAAPGRTEVLGGQRGAKHAQEPLRRSGLRHACSLWNCRLAFSRDMQDASR
jgi:hypothetical protein